MRKIKLSSLSAELQSKVLDQCCRTASKPLTKRELGRLLNLHKIPVTEFSGSGTSWELEVADEKTMDKIHDLITTEFRAYRTGYSSWVLTSARAYPGSEHDFNNPASCHHYGSVDPLVFRVLQASAYAQGTNQEFTYQVGSKPFDNLDDISRIYTKNGVVNSTLAREELRGQPTFFGLKGPKFGGQQNGRVLIQYDVGAEI